MVDELIRRLKSDPYINVFHETLNGGREEYESLKEFLRRVGPEFFSRYPQILLFFVGQFMRREVFKRGRLWKDLWPCIGMSEDYQIRLYDRIEAAISRMGIELICDGYNGRRLFVETFWREVGITPRNIREFLEIFWWYYDNFYPEREFDEILFKRHAYYHDFAEQFYLISDAVDKLIAVVEFVQDPDLPLIESPDVNIAEVRRKLHENLGFDPLQILPSEEYIIQVYGRSLNYVTPPKFKQIVKQKKALKILTPWGKSVPWYIVLADDNLAYGEYGVAERTYRVSPHPKISLEGMASWPLEKLISPLPGFIGYQSLTTFFVRRNEIELEPAELYLNRSSKSYIWCGRVPVGGSLIVDNREVPPLEGIQWQPTLKMRWPDVEKSLGPELEVEVGTIGVNLLELRGRKIEIKVGESGFPAVVRMTGSCRIDVPAVRLASDNVGNTPVQIVFENRVVAERIIELSDAMLFSASTRGRISKKRKWTGEYKFYLFSKAAVNSGTVKGAKIEAEYLYGEYHVYYIVRIGNELKIGEEDEYELFEPEFIQLRFEGDYIGNRCIIHELDKLSINVLTNITEERVKFNINVYKEIDLFRTMDHDVRLNKINSGICSYLFEGRKLLKNIPYGRYTLTVECDTVKSNPIMFSYIPSPEAIHGSEYTYTEGEEIVVTAKWNGIITDYVTRARVEQRMFKDKVICTPVIVEAKFDLLKERIVDFPARCFHVFSPVIFGIRILHPILDGSRPSESIMTHPERSDLKKAILYAFGRPKEELVLSLGSVCSRYEFDEHGELRIPLSFLYDKLANHINVLSVFSEGLERNVVIRWWPKVEGLPKITRLRASVYYEVEVFGPSDVMLEVRVVDIYGTVHQTSRHNLTGEIMIVEGHLRISPKSRYITLGFIVEGEYVPIHEHYRIPSKAVPNGAGIGASTDLLMASIEDYIKLRL